MFRTMKCVTYSASRILSTANRAPQQVPSGAHPEHNVPHSINVCILCLGVLYGMLWLVNCSGHFAIAGSMSDGLKASPQHDSTPRISPPAHQVI